jgi:EmrB/QacA subfamily drug resistance transporter
MTERLDPMVRRVVAVAFIGPFMTQIDSTVVNVALSTIRDDLHSTLDGAQWVVSGYLLALALMLPLNGWLVDRIGAKRMYVICFSGFTLASALCGLAPSIELLVAARLLQGMAGGLLAPMTQMMIARVAGKHIARVMGYTTVPVLVAPMVGPVVAGAILSYAGWPWLFFINVPIGAIGLVLAILLLPHDEPATEKRAFDALGFVLISPGLALLLYGFDQIAHLRGIACVALGAGLIVAFIRHTRRKQAAALIDLAIFRIRVFATGVRTQFLNNGVAYAGQLLVPLYLINSAHLSPAAAGWIIAPLGVGMLCTNPGMGWLTERFGFRTVATTGAAIVLVTTVPLLWMACTSYSAPVAATCMFLRGLGQGGIGIPSISAAYSSVPKTRLPVATTATNIVQRLGGPIATTAVAIVLAATMNSEGGSYPAAFVLLLALQVLTLASASRLPARVERAIR